MAEYKVKDIPVDSLFSEPVFLEEKPGVPLNPKNDFVLITSPLPFSRNLRKALMEWEFTTVHSTGVIREEGSLAVPEEASAGADAEQGGAGAEAGKRRQRAEGIYQSLLEFTDSLFSTISMSGFLNYAEAAEKMADFIKLITTDQYFLFRVMLTAEPRGEGNALAEHGVKSAIIALIIAGQIHLSTPQMVELGIAALLHEVEMLYIPTRIFLTNRQLSPEDKKLIFTHPVLGYKKLSSFNFPPLVCRAVLEHHELQDGSGYPQRLTADKISLYAKILAPACACTNAGGKPVRKDMRATIADLLENQSGKYDETIIKALYYAVAQLLSTQKTERPA
jgi:HD-GYP domain-containing protein (c-di-GMP phosphodiesterase class II)